MASSKTNKSQLRIPGTAIVTRTEIWTFQRASPSRALPTKTSWMTKKLMPLHNACNAAHQVRIDALNANPDYRARRAEIMNIAVEQKKPSPAKGAGGDPKND